MDLRSLNYFLCIIEEGNISKAAKKLHIAQPPLSHQLKLLEDELGVKLIERNTRSLQITEAGKALAERAKQILNLTENTKKEIKDISQGLQGTLSIGTVSSAGAVILPDIIYQFHQKYPDINFEILDEDTSKIIQLLSSGVVEIGIIRTPFDNDMFETINYAEDPMIAIAKNFECEEEPDVITFEYLKEIPLIVQKRYEKKIRHLCKSYGYEPHILCKSNDVRTILMLANIGMGVAIVPKNCLNLIPNSDLEYVIIDEPNFNIGTSILWSKDRYLSNVAQRFIENMQNHMPSII
ncbi:LysR family transcriptional regulator [Clostridium oryzae]|uniref:HTH-type transcriptional regulator CatM n=1 Tax=Clostridium oryzae TaxID=1450648 RepID=A0A1V4IJP0_9CLOT|nr:LysR family transcriptional regulator [Clostridium oryzae]OPJ60044.1 HTH-type transcriptional regulator CatM [Clostridium oryzae]